jgi:hypothetical protein
MRFNLLVGLIATTLFVGYFLPLVIKLKDVPLSIVLLGGIALVLVEFWESLRD